MCKTISSAQNPRVKLISKLRSRKHRLERKLILVEGHRELRRAVEAGISLDALYVADSLLAGLKDDSMTREVKSKECLWLINNAKNCGREVYKVADHVYQKISFGQLSGGILAVCHMPADDCLSKKLKPNPLFLVVEDIEKPGNFGAILRSCDGVGADGVIALGISDVFNPNVIRASLGTVFSVPVCRFNSGREDEEKLYRFFKENKICMCVATPSAQQVYTQTDFAGPSAIILGSEDKGASDFWMTHADVRMKIPMKGKADSLNVSVSAAIILYEALRQRSKAA